MDSQKLLLERNPIYLSHWENLYEKGDFTKAVNHKFIGIALGDIPDRLSALSAAIKKLENFNLEFANGSKFSIPKVAPDAGRGLNLDISWPYKPPFRFVVNDFDKDWYRQVRPEIKDARRKDLILQLLKELPLEELEKLVKIDEAKGPMPDTIRLTISYFKNEK